MLAVVPYLQVAVSLVERVRLAEVVPAVWAPDGDPEDLVGGVVSTVGVEVVKVESPPVAKFVVASRLFTRK